MKNVIAIAALLAFAGVASAQDHGGEATAPEATKTAPDAKKGGEMKDGMKDPKHKKGHKKEHKM